MTDVIKDSVVVGYLSGGDCRVEFTRSIGALHAHAFAKGIKLIGQLPHVSGPRIAAGRNHLVESFLATQGEWLLMVDDDMAFDGHVIERFLLVADRKERPIVGGLAFATGRDGIFPTLFRVVEGGVPTRLDAWPIGEVVEVDATGAACLFVHRSVFEKMAEEYKPPWQWFQETTLNGNSVGEDMTFCLRARSMGFPIFVDTANKFGHVKPRIIDEDEYFRWLNSHRFIITGTGRSGTAYLAAVLAFCRVRCGHEQWFTPEGYVPNPFLRGDASWMAAPFLGSLNFPAYILHGVRHPLDVINSYVGIRFFGDEDPTEDAAPYKQFARQHAPQVWEHGTAVERAMAWYLEWNRMIEPYAHKRVQVESLSGSDMYDLIRYAGAFHAPWEIQARIAEVPKNINTRPRADLTWEDLPDGELKAQLEVMAKDYGYEI